MTLYGVKSKRHFQFYKSCFCLKQGQQVYFDTSPAPIRVTKFIVYFPPNMCKQQLLGRGTFFVRA